MFFWVVGVGLTLVQSALWGLLVGLQLGGPWGFIAGLFMLMLFLRLDSLQNRR